MIIAIWALSIVLVMVTVYEITARARRETHSRRCYGGGTCHSFEGRYTRVELPPRYPSVRDGHVDGGTNGPEVKLFYKHDVCVWCGKVVNEQGTHV